jgi:hypothetical protein
MKRQPFTLANDPSKDSCADIHIASRQRQKTCFADANGSISHNDADYSKFLQSLLATKCQVSRHSKGGRIPEALGIAGGKATFFLKVAGKAGRMEPPFAHQ